MAVMDIYAAVIKQVYSWQKVSAAGHLDGLSVSLNQYLRVLILQTLWQTWFSVVRGALPYKIPW